MNTKLRLLLSICFALVVASSACAQRYLGDFAPTKSVYVSFNTYGADGAPITLAGSPAIAVYKDASTTESTAGVTLAVDFDARPGMHRVTIDTAADGTFYSAGSDFSVVITAGTVDGVSQAGTEVASFSLHGRSPLRPTTADRTLNVNASGFVGLQDGSGAGQINITNGSIDNVLSTAAASNCVVSSINTGAISAASFSPAAIDATVLDSALRLGIDWSKVANPTASVALTGTTVASGGAGATVSPAHVDADHTWRFDSPQQVVAPNNITEIVGSASILVAMDFDEPLPAASSIQSVSSVTIADVAGQTKPTITDQWAHTAKRKVIIDLATNAATAATYTVTVAILTTDSQTIIRQGRLVLQAQ